MSQTISQVVGAMDSYSTSIENLEIIDCFFIFYETRELLRNTQYLLVDWWFSRPEVQSKSAKPLLVREFVVGNKDLE